MSLTLQELKDRIVYRTLPMENDPFGHYKIMDGVLKVQSKVTYDPEFPVEEIAKERVEREILDQLFERRYQEIAKAVHEFAKYLFVVDPQAMEKFNKLRDVIFNGDTLTPPIGYQPSDV